MSISQATSHSMGEKIGLGWERIKSLSYKIKVFIYEPIGDEFRA